MFDINCVNVNTTYFRIPVLCKYMQVQCRLCQIALALHTACLGDGGNMLRYMWTVKVEESVESLPTATQQSQHQQQETADLLHQSVQVAPRLLSVVLIFLAVNNHINKQQPQPTQTPLHQDKQNQQIKYSAHRYKGLVHQ